MGVLEKSHMMEFLNIINAICVDDLGFDASIFPIVRFKPELKKRVLEDIMHPKYTVSEPILFFSRMFYKFKRWKGNGWKHEICYNESLWSAFWSGVWAHILKPSSL